MPAENEESLRHRAELCPDFATLESLTAEVLQQVTKREGVDFATALLFDRFQKSPERAEFIQRINTLRQNPPQVRLTINAKVVIVPGALYLERPDMGGDGRIVREVAEKMGWQTDLIPLRSFGSVTENALLLHRWLEQHSTERIILVSLSKGGADLKMALAATDAPSLFRNVIAWVNVCGPLNGSHMANWVLTNCVRNWFFRLKFLWQKRNYQFITDLRHDANTPLAFPLRPPRSIKVLSLIGFPLQQHMTTRFSRFCHRTLAANGPNDGTTLLSDLHDWPGEIYPAWGMDHYFRPEKEARNLVAAVFQHLAEQPVSQ